MLPAAYQNGFGFIFKQCFLRQQVSDIKKISYRDEKTQTKK